MTRIKAGRCLKSKHYVTLSHNSVSPAFQMTYPLAAGYHIKNNHLLLALFDSLTKYKHENLGLLLAGLPTDV